VAQSTTPRISQMQMGSRSNSLQNFPASDPTIVDVGSPTPVMTLLVQAANARVQNCSIGPPTPAISE
jgi:hypothetical protein